MDITALIFDFDGTLLDTETPIYDEWGKEYRRHGQRLGAGGGRQAEDEQEARAHQESHGVAQGLRRTEVGDGQEEKLKSQHAQVWCLIYEEGEVGKEGGKEEYVWEEGQEQRIRNEGKEAGKD